MRALPIAAVLALLAGCGGGEGDEAPPVVGSGDLVRAAGVQRVEPDVRPGAVAERAAAAARFGLALQGALAQPDENLVLSPYSVTRAFALAYAGARGETREQLSRALRFPEDGDELHPVLNALDRAIESRAGKGVVVETANAAWGQRAFPWERPFLETLARHHGAGMHTADFVGDPEAAAAALDEWVREKTRGKIRDLFSAEDFDPLTRLVLANAAYLRAKWLVPFDPEATTDDTFHAPGGDVEVPTMHAESRRQVAAGSGWRAVELPYEGARLAMLVVLPDQGQLDAVQERLADGLLADIPAALREAHVELALPRFRVETKADLVPALRALGATLPFEERADFRGMSAKERLYIAKARQKAFVEVDEHGTEAAAATGIVANLTSKPPPAEPFVVDRPFLFVIRDRPTGAVLFSGRVTDPSRG